VKRLVVTGLFLLWGHAYGMDCDRFKQKNVPQIIKTMMVNSCRDFNQKMNKQRIQFEHMRRKAAERNKKIEANNKEIERHIAYQQFMDGEL